jgi:hypothetical protein
MKIDNQTDSFLAQFQVRQNLRLMNGGDLLNAFQLNNHGVIDKQIDAIAKINEHRHKSPAAQLGTAHRTLLCEVRAPDTLRKRFPGGQALT